MTDYPGIDYGRGQSNIDPETRIRFGVINMNVLNERAWEEFEPDYGEPCCPECGNEVVDYDDNKHRDYLEIGRGCCDYACESCERTCGNDNALADEPCGYYLDDGEYKAIIDSYNDVMIIKSPYYTHAQFCSPCVPGAGHLENPCPTGPKTYCFGHDWFENDVAPYPVFRVNDNSEVKPEEKLL